MRLDLLKQPNIITIPKNLFFAPMKGRKSQSHKKGTSVGWIFL